MSGLLHAEGPIDDRTLCGIAYEGTYDDSFMPPATAGFGEVVTCDDCRRIITYCQEGFTSRFLKRRAALSKAKGEA